MKDLKNKGWVSLWRKIEDNPIWFLEPFSKAQAWIDLFLNANYKKGFINIRGNIIEVQRGQIAWSELTMAKRWKWSRNKVHSYLKWLETIQQIEQQKSTLTTIIMILSYDKYQEDEITEIQKTIQQKVQQKVHKQYINKEIKNNNNILADKQQAPSSNGKKEIKPYIRKPEGQRTQLQHICYFLEDTLHTKIVNWGKQASALSMMLKSGYTEKQILWSIKHMANDDFYMDKGFDLMTVANNIDKIKASARKVVENVL